MKLERALGRYHDEKAAQKGGENRVVLSGALVRKQKKVMKESKLKDKSKSKSKPKSKKEKKIVNKQ